MAARSSDDRPSVVGGNQRLLWRQIHSPYDLAGDGFDPTQDFPAFGPQPLHWNEYRPWHTQISSLLCPSDGTKPRDHADTNYAINWGDNGYGNGRNNSASRGMAVGNVWSGEVVNLGIESARDGTVNTLLLAEVGRADGNGAHQGAFLAGVSGLDDDATQRTVDPQTNCVVPATDAVNPGTYPDTANVVGLDAWGGGRGGTWALGVPAYTGFNTILPPNGPSCVQGPAANWWQRVRGGVYSAGSYHTGIVQAVMVDGSVRSISETIDSGSAGNNAAVRGQSTYGVWGALGSRGGGETVDEF